MVCIGACFGITKHRNLSGRGSSGSAKKRSLDVKLEQAYPDVHEELRRLSKGATYGIVRFEVVQATLPERASYVAVVSIGAQSFLSSTSVPTETPQWRQGYTLVLQKLGASIATIQVHSEGNTIGRGEVDLKQVFESPNSTARVELVVDLVDPCYKTQVIGTINVCAEASSVEDLERQFWKRLLALVDLNGDGVLHFDEFAELMQCLGQDLNKGQLWELYRKADKNGDGRVCDEELAVLVTEHRRQSGSSLMRRCPVSGVELDPHDDFSNLVYMTLAMEETAEESLQGGFLTAEDATRSWMLRLSEWATHPIAGNFAPLIVGNSYGVGLNVGPKAAHILVLNRATKALEEEVTSPLLNLAMRNMYQSTTGRTLLKAGGWRVLQRLTERQGKYMDDPSSRKEIRKFVEQFRGVIDLSECLEPLDSYKTFNEFFYRKLKPDARPIFLKSNPNVVVSAADCRLTAFNSVDEATQFWIKGKRFSVKTLLNDPSLADEFVRGAKMVIFRLAPQDYHRYHMPVSGTIRSIQEVPGQYYTVNPIAVNAEQFSVLSENHRVVVTIDSPDFGLVIFVAIGATLVGSCNFTVSVGATLSKGDELGYFAFGGSTIVVLFKENAVELDKDLVENSKESLETLVKMGDRIGARPGHLGLLSILNGVMRKSSSFKRSLSGLLGHAHGSSSSKSLTAKESQVCPDEFSNNPPRPPSHFPSRTSSDEAALQEFTQWLTWGSKSTSACSTRQQSRAHSCAGSQSQVHIEGLDKFAALSSQESSGQPHVSGVEAKCVEPTRGSAAGLSIYVDGVQDSEPVTSPFARHDVQSQSGPVSEAPVPHQHVAEETTAFRGADHGQTAGPEGHRESGSTGLMHSCSRGRVGHFPVLLDRISEHDPSVTNSPR